MHRVVQESGDIPSRLYGVLLVTDRAEPESGAGPECPRLMFPTTSGRVNQDHAVVLVKVSVISFHLGLLSVREKGEMRSPHPHTHIEGSPRKEGIGWLLDRTFPYTDTESVP